jgi:amino acid efflux transporter
VTVAEVRDSGSPAPLPTPARPALRRTIRLRHAVALYVSSVLGSGILVLPGLTARIAGPGALLAWMFLAVASVPFALTFASLSARRPESGGIYAFAKEGLGPGPAVVAGWLFGLWEVAGVPAVALIAASYLGYAFPLNRPETYLIGFAVVLVAFIVNLFGIVLSSKVQLTVIASIVVLLVGVVVVSARYVRPENFQPFLPFGLLPVGTAAALIFWAMLGYENVSNVAEEFEDPGRDFRRSVLISVALVGALYFAVALVTVGTAAYASGGGLAPFAAILRETFGTYAAAATAILAVFIVFGVVNAYTTGMSRVALAVARDGGYPAALAHLQARTRVPDRAMAALFGLAALVFVGYYLADVSLATALLVASGAAISVYVFGCAAGARIYSGAGEARGRSFWLAVISLGISLGVLPFIGWPLLVTGGVAVAAWLYWRWGSGRPRAARLARPP